MLPSEGLSLTLFPSRDPELGPSRLYKCLHVFSDFMGRFWRILKSMTLILNQLKKVLKISLKSYSMKTFAQSNKSKKLHFSVAFS
jgi:hypothetical protein